jgi:hypothetical protein
MRYLPIATALVHAAELRVIALEVALMERDWHPDDPLKRELESRLVEANNRLAAQHEMARQELCTG